MNLNKHKCRVKNSSRMLHNIQISKVVDSDFQNYNDLVIRHLDYGSLAYLR